MDRADHLGQPVSLTPEQRCIERVVRCFDGAGRLLRWPSKRSEQLLALWIVWSYLPNNRQMSEPDVNSMLRDWHDYEDFVLLRRELIDLEMLRRTPDGRIYRKISHDMPEDAASVLARFGPG